MRTLTILASSLIALAACADVGPFRATGSESTADGGMGTTSDGASGMEPDGAVVDDGVPVLVASPPARPSSLAVTPAHVYWVQLDNAKLGRVAKTGGSLQAIDIGSYPDGLTARASEVYWVATDGIRRASDAAFASTAVHTATGLVDALAVTDSSVLFFERGAGVGNDQLRSVPRGGGSPQTLRASLTSPRAVAVAGSTLYTATSDAIEQAPLATPTSATLVASATNGRLSVTTSRACWTVRPNPNLYATEVWCRAQGAAAVQIATAPQYVHALLVTASAVYWIPQANNASTTIQVHRFATGVTSTVWTPPAGWFATALATDGGDLYWLATNDVTGQIWRRAL